MSRVDCRVREKLVEKWACCVMEKTKDGRKVLHCSKEESKPLLGNWYEL